MSPIHQLTNQKTHSEFSSTAESTGNPTVLYVSNCHLPACKTFTPKYTQLADRYVEQITFAQMELTAETSMLFKFAPNQLPVLTLMCRQSERKGGMMWAKTVMGADMAELERGIEEMLGRAGR
ncbi:hypothetical protein VTL71DRAFT_6042 [Oculimacula yallundae]|uniref:Thioredoxin domain-containing protein n=1 Tax=Oculimacula yallundae TaxID=86028 RepID=A0ABR4BZ84_9HELO